MVKPMMTPRAALQRLKDGNARFVEGQIRAKAAEEDRRRALAMGGQRPFAVILGCSDSRVPSEMVFDQGMGDLFVIRVAGNVVQPSILGSIEFAALQLSTPLCVVMGHSGCGAIKMALNQELNWKEPPSLNVRVLLDEIQPSVKRVLARHSTARDKERLAEPIMRMNVQHTIERIKDQSVIIRRKVEARQFAVVGAGYDLMSGRVAFFDPGSKRRIG